MSEVQTPVRRRREGNAANIYLVMMFTTIVALGTAVGIMWYMNVQLTQDSNPFAIVQVR